MNLPVVFRPQAEAEVLAARQWYEERRTGLGDQFQSALEEVIERVNGYPESFPRVHGEMRRALVQRFPFGLYFEIVENQVVVLGVVHGHRDPRIWKSRR
jgi:plasmid stabilization system protein ParE